MGIAIGSTYIKGIKVVSDGGGASINNQDITVTPSTTAFSVSASSGYTGLGTVTVEAIPSAYIIPTGTSNITTNGTYDIASYASVSVNIAGNVDQLDLQLSNSLYEYVNSTLTIMPSYAFYYRSNLSSVAFDAVTTIRDRAFYYCSRLTSASFPNCLYIYSYAFRYCS